MLAEWLIFVRFRQRMGEDRDGAITKSTTTTTVASATADDHGAATASGGRTARICDAGCAGAQPNSGFHQAAKASWVAPLIALRWCLIIHAFREQQEQLAKVVIGICSLVLMEGG